MREFIVPSRTAGSGAAAAVSERIVSSVTGFGGITAPAQRTYYPSASIVEQAQPIVVAAGEERWSIDVVVQRLQLQSVPAVARALVPDVHVFMRDGVPTIDFGSGRPLGPDCPPRSACRGAIRGRVLRADGAPIRQAFVWLLVDDAQDTPLTVITDDLGRYEFQRLPGGSFRVAASSPGYITVQYGQARPLAAGEPIELPPDGVRDRIDITLPRVGAVAGRLVDEWGDPVEGVDVSVLRVGYESGRRQLIAVAASRRTDDAGRFRVYGLQPGQYVVRAVARVPVSATTYFPGSVNLAEAQFIPVGFSQDVVGLDFALSSAPTAGISGMALDSMGRPLRGSVTLRSSRRLGSLDTVAVAADLRADGTFEFLRVPSGEYAIQAETNPTRLSPVALRAQLGMVDEFAAGYVTVAGTDVSGVTIHTSPGSTVAGHLTLEGQVGEFFHNEIDLMAVAVNPDLSSSRRTSYMGISPDLTVGIDGIAGPRVFRLTRAPRGWALKAVLLNGVDVTDTPLDFGAPAQSVRDLEIVLTERASEVSGRVDDTRGRAVPEATVVVFTGDRQLWGPASRFVAMAKTGRDGTFTIRGLPPAGYVAAAVDSVADGEWQAPEFLDAVFPAATSMPLFEGEKLSINLRLVAR